MCGSSPRNMRLMLSVWRMKIAIANARDKNATETGAKNQANTGDAAAATSAANEDIRRVKAVATQVRQTARPTGQLIPKRTPMKVATPLRLAGIFLAN